MNERTRTLTPRTDAIQEPPKRVKSDALVWLYADSLKQLARQLETELSAPSQAVTEGMIAELDSMQGELAWYHKKITGTDSAGKLWAESFKDELREYHKTLTAALRSAPPSSQKQEGEELDVLRLRNGFMTNPDGSHEPTYGHYVRKSDYDRLRDERDAAVREIKRLVPLECCEGGDPNCYGPRGCLVRAQQAERTPNDVLLARAEKAEAALEAHQRDAERETIERCADVCGKEAAELERLYGESEPRAMSQRGTERRIRALVDRS